jgi:5-dehydro-2-deoxygluconokinase
VSATGATGGSGGGGGGSAVEPFDVLTMGRVGVDLYPLQSRVPLEDVQSFAKSLGGTATNVAVGAARYGHRAAVITKVGDDPFGRYVRNALVGFGVDPRYVGTDPRLRTPVVFTELFPPDSFPILFYREPRAPDINLTLEELDLEAIRAARIFWTTGTGLSAQPSRSATLGALQARARSGITVHDLDFRPTFWASPASARRYQRRALRLATAAVGNREEATVAVGEGEPEAQAERLLELGPQVAVVKLGPEGVLVASPDGMERIPPVTVDVVNGLGAGDAFGAALCHGLLEEWPLVRTVRFANAAGAYVAARLACADAMPNEAEVEELLAHA